MQIQSQQNNDNILSAKINTIFKLMQIEFGRRGADAYKALSAQHNYQKYDNLLNNLFNNLFDKSYIIDQNLVQIANTTEISLTENLIEDIIEELQKINPIDDHIEDYQTTQTNLFLEIKDKLNSIDSELYNEMFNSPDYPKYDFYQDNKQYVENYLQDCKDQPLEFPVSITKRLIAYPYMIAWSKTIVQSINNKIKSQSAAQSSLDPDKDSQLVESDSDAASVGGQNESNTAATQSLQQIFETVINLKKKWFKNTDTKTVLESQIESLKKGLVAAMIKADVANGNISKMIAIVENLISNAQQDSADKNEPEEEAKNSPLRLKYRSLIAKLQGFNDTSLSSNIETKVAMSPNQQEAILDEISHYQANLEILANAIINYDSTTLHNPKTTFSSMFIVGGIVGAILYYLPVIITWTNSMLSSYGFATIPAHITSTLTGIFTFSTPLGIACCTAVILLLAMGIYMLTKKTDKAMDIRNDINVTINTLMNAMELDVNTGQRIYKGHKIMQDNAIDKEHEITIDKIVKTFNWLDASKDRAQIIHEEQSSKKSYVTNLKVLIKETDTEIAEQETQKSSSWKESTQKTPKQTLLEETR